MTAGSSPRPATSRRPGLGRARLERPDAGEPGLDRLRAHHADRREPRLRQSRQPGAAAEPRAPLGVRDGSDVEFLASSRPPRSPARRPADFSTRSGRPSCSGCAFSFFVTAALLMLLIRTRPARLMREKVTLETLFAGIRFIKSRPAIFGAISLDLFAVLLGGATALLPIYARDILQVGPWASACCAACPRSARSRCRCSWRTAAPEPARACACSRPWPSSASPPSSSGCRAMSYVSIAALFLLGCADMVSVYVRQSLVQGDTPDAMRGRVRP